MLRMFLKRAKMLSLALAVALAIPVYAPYAAVAASTYDGGPDNDPPIYGLNDHTPMAVHYSATGLAPNTTYSVKVRFTVGLSPSGGTNRGWTWNPTTHEWVQEREGDWAKFPTVTSDASGTVTSNAGWVWAKFGDENASGPYYVAVALNAGGAQGTSNPTTPTPIAILDAKTQGSWVHNGIATGTAADKRAEVAASDATTTVWALSKTEANLVDDNSNGLVDDASEGFGPAGLNGDYRMGVPANMLADLFLNRVKKFNDFTTPAADTEVALGAADMTPPSAVGSVNASTPVGSIVLDWGAASDDQAVAAYRVSSWVQPVGAQPWTPAPQVATETVGLGFTDTTPRANGTVVKYEIRAIDTSGNVGPRTVVTATAASAVPTVDLAVDPIGPTGSNGWYTGSTAPTITISGTDADSIEYSWDTTSSTWTTYTAPVAALSGDHTLYARGVDQFGAGEISSVRVKWDGTAPVIQTFAVPRFASDLSANRYVLLKWPGIDQPGGSGGVTYDVQYRVGGTPGWNNWLTRTAAPSARFTAGYDKTYYFRVRVIDAAGNVGPYTTEKMMIVPRDQTAMRFSRSWTTATSSSYWLDTVRYSKARGASATFSYTGKDLYLIMSSGPSRGKVSVYVDGKYVKTIDTRSSKSTARKAFLVKTFSVSSRHSVRVVNAGPSSRPRVDLDGYAARR